MKRKEIVRGAEIEREREREGERGREKKVDVVGEIYNFSLELFSLLIRYVCWIVLIGNQDFRGNG